MRDWNINPKLLCRKHLLGNHYELHKFVGAYNKGKRLDGYYQGLIQLSLIVQSHKGLVKEMEHRGYKHNTPLEFEFKEDKGFIDRKRNVKDLKKRCGLCLTK